MVAFNNKMISDIILAISANISNNNVTDVYNIIYYIFIFIVYFGYAIILTINCIEYLNSLVKYGLNSQIRDPNKAKLKYDLKN